VDETLDESHKQRIETLYLFVNGSDSPAHGIVEGWSRHIAETFDGSHNSSRTGSRMHNVAMVVNDGVRS
jgi:hypothetical protein